MKFAQTSSISTLMLILLSLFSLFHVSQTQILNDSMITFQMLGETTYTPDIGGSTLNGYKIRLGFSRYQWLGVRFMMNNNKDDLIVIQIDQFYSDYGNPLKTGHQIIADDYYISSDLVNADRNIQNDISAFEYSQTKDYYIDLIRYAGSNDGEDWNGPANKYSLLDVCFYTSQELFDSNKLLQGISQCYSYEIKNYHSLFKGQKLKEFYINGYKTQINGWIGGPYVTGNLYFYQKTPLYTYTQIPAFAIEIGTTTNQLGQDFYVVSPISSQSGDYYGKQMTSVVKDNTQNGGFQNGIFTLQDWNADPGQQISAFPYTAWGVTFSRNVSTHDPYDKILKSTMVFCLYMFTEGTIMSQLSDKSCQAVQISYHYPRIGLTVKQFEGIINRLVFLSILVFMLVLQ